MPVVRWIVQTAVCSRCGCNQDIFYQPPGRTERPVFAITEEEASEAGWTRDAFDLRVCPSCVNAPPGSTVRPLTEQHVQ